jgi:hypothetical protein
MSRFHFIFIAGVTLFLYFEVMTQIWFVGLIGGYMVKVWVPPLALFIYVVMQKLVKRRQLFEPNFLNLMLILYAAFGIISILLSEGLYFGLKFYLIMIAPIWYYAVILYNFRDNRDIELMIKILVLCSLLMSIYTYLLQAQYEALPYDITREVVTRRGGVIGLSEGGFVESGIVYSRGLRSYEHGKYCGMIAPVILFSILFFIKSKRWIKYVYVAISGFLLLQIIDTYSRSGIISTFIGIAFLVSSIFINERKERIKIVVLSLLVAVPSIPYLIGYKFPVFLRLIQILNILNIGFIDDYLYSFKILAFSTESYFDPHFQTIYESLNTFFTSPLLGSGYRFSELLMREHNRYLFVLISAGLVTFIPYILFIGGLTLFIRKAMLKSKYYKSVGIPYGYFFYACQIMFGDLLLLGLLRPRHGLDSKF